MLRRPWLTGMAVLGWFGLTVQVYLVLLARWQEQASLIGGLINVFGYFTVLTNTLVATVLSYAAFGREGRARHFFLSPSVSSAVAASIVLVALAYSVLLAARGLAMAGRRVAARCDAGAVCLVLVV